MKMAGYIGILVFASILIYACSQQFISEANHGASLSTSTRDHNPESYEDFAPPVRNDVYPEILKEDLDGHSGDWNMEKVKPASSVYRMTNAVEYVPSISPSPEPNDHPPQGDLTLSNISSVEVQTEESSVLQSSTTASNDTAIHLTQSSDSISPSSYNTTEGMKATEGTKTPEDLSSTIQGNYSTPNTTPSDNDVVLKADENPSFTKNLFQKSIAWMNDTYTLSIVVPITAGLVFAAVVIILVSVVKCMRRRCFRRRFRRKVLKDTIRNMKPSDQARLLAESSDEEF